MWTESIDWAMMLPEELDGKFWDELHAYEKEKQMPYVSSVEKIGMKKGIQKGIRQGINKGVRKDC